MSSLFNIAAGGQAGFYGYQINDSLRVPFGNNPELARTNSSAPTNNSKGTFSCWIKRGLLGSGTGNNQYIIHTGTGASNNTHMDLKIETNDEISIGSYSITPFDGTAKFRDPSAWYHIVVAFDSTSATASEREIKVYINGVESTDGTKAAISQNQQFPWINQSQEINIFRHVSVNRPYDGYIADINMIDGQALDPTSFGETKSGVWIPKDTSGLTFGTNGFRLEFGDSAAIGDDTSGNGNDFTATNLSAHDVVPDSPTLNYSTLNPLRKHAGATLSEGNLTVTHDSGGGEQPATFAISSGKWYWEVKQSTQYAAYGLLQVTANPSSASIVSGYHWYGANGSFYTGTTAGTNLGTFGSSDIISIAYNADDNELTFYKNGVSAGTESIVDNEYYPDFGAGTSVASTVNFGQDSTFAGATTAGGNSDANGYGDFKYAVPSGYLALNSANLPEPSITPLDDDVPEDYFNTVLYDGNNDTGSQAITGVGFQPDFLWLKGRNAVTNHILADSVRGTGTGMMGALFTNLTNAEETTTSSTHSTFGIISSLDSDGFTVDAGATNSGGTNFTGRNYVAWNWLSGGTAVSNTDGTITSSVSANTKAGFSIATYTGTGSNATVGHGLSSAPEMIFLKRRNATAQWIVGATPVGWTKYLGLNATSAAVTSADAWNNTDPTSTVFSLATGSSVNASGGTYVAYCFHSVEGYSKIGSYTGNGSTTDGTFVYTGFRPAWVMVKKTNGAGNWVVTDNKRDPVNVIDALLSPDLPNVETDTDAEDFTSNGFKMRDAHNTRNASGGNYIYMAFAEMPFKYANAR